MTKNLSKEEFENEIKRKLKKNNDRIKRLQRKRIRNMSEKLELIKLSYKMKKEREVEEKQKKEKKKEQIIKQKVKIFHSQFKTQYQIFTIFEN